jgi:hypothetical protein
MSHYGFHVTKIASVIAAEANIMGEKAPAAEEILAAAPHRFWADQSALRNHDLGLVVDALEGIDAGELAAIAADRQLPGFARELAAVLALADHADLDEATTAELIPVAFGRLEMLRSTAATGAAVSRMGKYPRTALLHLVKVIDDRLHAAPEWSYGPDIARLEWAAARALGPVTVDEVLDLGVGPGTIWHLRQGSVKVAGGWMGLAPFLPVPQRAGAVLAGLVAGEELDECLARRVFARMGERTAAKLVRDPMRVEFASNVAFNAPVVSAEALVPLAASEHLAVRLLAVGLGHVPADVDAFLDEMIATTRNTDASSEWRGFDGWIAQIISRLPLTDDQVARLVAAWPFEARHLAARHRLGSVGTAAAVLMYAPVQTVAAWLAGALATEAPSPEAFAEALDDLGRFMYDHAVAAVAHHWGPSPEWAAQLLRVRPALARAYVANQSPTTVAALYEVFRDATVEEIAAL